MVSMEIQGNLNEINWDKFEQQESNYVKLVAGKPKILNLVSVAQTNENITDNKTGEEKIVPALKFKVDEEDGKKVDKEFTVLSKILAKQLKPIVINGLPKKLSITRYGTGFDTEYEVKLTE